MIDTFVRSIRNWQCESTTVNIGKDLGEVFSLENLGGLIDPAKEESPRFKLPYHSALHPIVTDTVNSVI